MADSSRCNLRLPHLLGAGQDRKTYVRAMTDTAQGKGEERLNQLEDDVLELAEIIGRFDSYITPNSAWQLAKSIRKRRKTREEKKSKP